MSKVLVVYKKVHSGNYETVISIRLIEDTENNRELLVKDYYYNTMNLKHVKEFINGTSNLLHLVSSGDGDEYYYEIISPKDYYDRLVKKHEQDLKELDEILQVVVDLTK